MNTALITGCFLWLRPRDRAPLPHAGLEGGRTMRTPRDGCAASLGTAPRTGARRDEAESIAAALEASGPIDVSSTTRESGSSARSKPRRCPRHAMCSRPHLRRDGADPGGAASVPRAQVRRGGERNLERDPLADAVGRRVHRQQDGDRRVHRVARPRTRGLQRACQAGRARLRSRPPAFPPTPDASGRPHSRSVRALRAADLRRVRTAGRGYDESTLPSSLACRERCVRAASIPRGC